MASLSSRSDEEIIRLLDGYGIKHGPVVDSTRRLYEKKILEAMATGTKGKTLAPSPDKTYYREEEEEVTYVYKLPVKREASGDRSAYLRSRPEPLERDSEEEEEEEEGEEEEEETTSSNSYQPSHSRYSPYYREKDKFHRSAYLRSRPGPSERDSEEEEEAEEETTSSSSYQPTQSRYKPDYREKDRFDSSYMYDTLSSFRRSCTPPPLVQSGPDAAKANRSSGLVPMWVKAMVFLILAVVLYLVIYKVQKNESLKEIP